MELILHLMFIEKNRPPTEVSSPDDLLVEELKTFLADFYSMKVKDWRDIDFDQISSVINPIPLKNVLESLSSDLTSLHMKFEDLKKTKIEEMRVKDGRMLRRRELLPETGVLVMNEEGNADTTSALDYVKDFIDVYRASYPTTFKQYFQYYGAEIIFAMDKLQSEVWYTSAIIKWFRVLLWFRIFNVILDEFKVVGNMYFRFNLFSFFRMDLPRKELYLFSWPRSRSSRNVSQKQSQILKCARIIV